MWFEIIFLWPHPAESKYSFKVMSAATASKSRPGVMPPVICRVTICHILLDGMAWYVSHSRRALYGFEIVITCRGKWQNVWISQKLFNGPSVFLGGEKQLGHAEGEWGGLKWAQCGRPKFSLMPLFCLMYFLPYQPLPLAFSSRSKSRIESAKQPHQNDDRQRVFFIGRFEDHGQHVV